MLNSCLVSGRGTGEMKNKELKTLKDLRRRKIFNPKTDEFDLGAFMEEELKAEAVKWVKSDKMVSNDIKLWIEHFFNITEEDLKDG